jgi:hypothetical protein
MLPHSDGLKARSFPNLGASGAIVGRVQPCDSHAVVGAAA